MLTGNPSVNALSGWWHDAQLRALLADKRRSKKRYLPIAICSSVAALPGGGANGVAIDSAGRVVTSFGLGPSWTLGVSMPSEAK